MKARLPFQMKRNQFIGLGILGLIILLVHLGIYYLKNQKEEKPVLVDIVDKTEQQNIVLSEFNPNDLSAEEWQKLGFSERQVKIILKYKDIVGGRFISKEQLAKCYVISPEKFVELEPFILLPKAKNEFQKNTFRKRELNIFGKFNPDFYTEKDWVKLGYSEKQAVAIIKYKNYLGGSFRSKEKFKECFIISDEDYLRLAPYLILPEKEEKKESLVSNKIKYNYFDPNVLDLEGWKNLGFSEKQAQVILNYKERNLRGSFKNLEDIQKCFVISVDKFLELKPWIKIKEQEQKSITEELPKLKEVQKIDFSKIDVNQITFKQLIEFGFDEKSAASFLGFRKKLGGFVDKKQILETYNISQDLAKKLVEITNLDTSKIQKYSLKDAPEDFLKNHPYFRRYGDKIIFFRITYPEEKEIFKKIKATSEEVAKMKLYLK